MYRIAAALISLGCLLPATTTAEPIVLGTAGVGGEISTFDPGVQPGLIGRFFWGHEPGSGLFGVTLTADDAGRVFRATADTDPEFASIAARLTNGINESTYFSLRFDDGVWAASEDNEEHAFKYDPVQGRRGPPGPDFFGSTITAITYRLDAFSLADGPGFRSFFLNGLLTLEGKPAAGTPDPIPEPATVVLAATGVAILARQYRYRRRHPTVGERSSRQ